MEASRRGFRAKVEDKIAKEPGINTQDVKKAGTPVLLA